MYWDEKNNEWSDFGCVLASYENGTGVATCQCNHTTKFSTFIEFRTRNWTTIMQHNETNASLLGSFIHYELYVQYMEIAFGFIFASLSILVLLLLVIYRKHQPVSSRLIAPYLGMTALLIESILVSILQRALSLSSGTSNDPSQDNSRNDSNIIVALVENISLIVVNTLNLTAILSYFIQVVRFQFMKALSHKMLLNSKRNVKSMLRHIRWLRFLTSRWLFILIIAFSVIGNLVFWTLWVILRRLDIISSQVFTTVTSLSYMFIILGYSVFICFVIVIDFIRTCQQSNISFQNPSTQVENNVSTPQHDTLTKSISFKRTVSLSRVKSESTIQSHQTHVTSACPLKNTELSVQQRSFLRKLFHLDTPLYFRAEMMLYLVCFLFMMVQLGIGFASQFYENHLFKVFTSDGGSLDSEEEFKMHNNVMVMSLLILKIFSLLSEICYTICYIAIFGGFSLFVLFKYKLKSSKMSHSSTNKQHMNTTSTTIGDFATSKTNTEEYLFEESEVLSLIRDDLGFRLFEEFSEREFSLENLYFYLELYSNQNIILGQEIHELPSFLEQLNVNYIASTAPYEVNLPSQAKQMFYDLKEFVERLKMNTLIWNEMNNSTPSSTLNSDDVLQVDSLREQDTKDQPISDQVKELREQLIVCFDRLVNEVFVNLGDTFYRFIQTPEYKFYMESINIKKTVSKQTNMAWIEPSIV
nr:unnamed protein product [Naegleria fowleri]